MNDSTFSRLFIIMILFMTVLSILLAVLASIASSGVNARLDERSDIENTKPLAERIAPVGQFAALTGSTEVPATSVILSGQEAYAGCAACHGTGITGAPIPGQKSDWTDRIVQGIETLYDHAINGYTGAQGTMPAKGGNHSLSDESVKAAVDFMLEQSL